MSYITAWLSAGGVALFLCVGGVRAATPNPTDVSLHYENTVAPTQQQAYKAGIKSFNQCLNQRGFKHAVTAWEHTTGNMGMYFYIIDLPNWSSLDSVRVVEAGCDSVWDSDVAPHVQSEFSAIETLMPGFSHAPTSGWPTTALPLVVVVHYTLKSGNEAYETFTKDVKMIYAAESKANWPHYSVTSGLNLAGRGAPDFELTIPAENWAEIGAEPNPPVWKMLANVYGQKKANQIRKSLNDAIANTESHVNRYDPDLSYAPSLH